YNWNLFKVLPGFGFEVYVISPLHLKKSIGLVRGKNDKVDAHRICLFIEKNRSEMKQWKPTPLAIRKMKVLLAERSSRVKRTQHCRDQQRDCRLMRDIALDGELMKLNKKLIQTIDQHIRKLETAIQKTVELDEQLKSQSKLLRSVPGVGK